MVRNLRSRIAPDKVAETLKPRISRRKTDKIEIWKRCVTSGERRPVGSENGTNAGENGPTGIGDELAAQQSSVRQGRGDECLGAKRVKESQIRVKRILGVHRCHLLKEWAMVDGK